MADVDCGFVSCDVVKLAVDLGLGDRVQGCGGLVKDDERGIFVKSSGDGYLLGFAAGYFHTFFIKLFVKIGGKAVFHLLI